MQMTSSLLAGHAGCEAAAAARMGASVKDSVNISALKAFLQPCYWRFSERKSVKKSTLVARRE